MTAVGRNEPCPCGSGVKFKKCCLNESVQATSYLPAERDSALAKLMRFCAREEFIETHQIALVLFWGDWLGEEPDGRLEKVMDSDQSELAYHSWFAFDFDIGDEKSMLDLFLQREGAKISPRERQYLEGMRESQLRVYEVVEVKADEGFRVRDLWDDRRLWVRERLGTRQIVKWDLVAGRIGTAGDGVKIFEALPYVFSAALKDEFVVGLRKAHRRFTCEFPGASIVRFFRFMAPVLHKMWLDQVALLPFPKILTAEGDPVIFAKVIFEILDRERVESTLRDRADIIDHGDGSYGWVKATGELDGAIVLEERRLVFETMSKRRAERGRDFWQELLQEAVDFKAIIYEDVSQAIKRAPVRENKAPEVPLEVQAEVSGHYYEEHYRKWLDEPVPALDHRTPRDAARQESVRPKLIALLKDFESRSERQRRSGRIAYDFSWMWKELGLNRE